jgi:hypothetical protein
MNVVHFNDRSCERYRRYFDAYLDNELLVETNQDLLQHLTSCAECSRILEDRARMKQLVREAVEKQQVPLELVETVRHRLRMERGSFFGFNAARWPMAAAAVLVLAIGSLGILQWGGILRFTDIDSPLRVVSAQVEKILRVGLVDHVHCTILFQQWKRFFTFDEMKASTGRAALGPEFIDLVPAVQSKLGTNLKIVNGHRCTADGRQYIHLIVTGDNNRTLLSVIITEKRNESFAEADASALVRASGVPIYHERQGILEVAGFESGKYLAYVISNLDHEENLKVASDLAPLVHDHLRRLEL